MSLPLALGGAGVGVLGNLIGTYAQDQQRQAQAEAMQPYLDQAGQALSQG